MGDHPDIKSRETEDLCERADRAIAEAKLLKAERRDLLDAGRRPWTAAFYDHETLRLAADAPARRK